MMLPEIWRSLETAPSTRGYVRRRMEPESACDLFLAVTKPSNSHLLHIQFTEIPIPALSSLPSARGLDVAILPSGNEQDGFIIQLGLRENSFATIFDILVEDMIEVLAQAPSQSTAITAFISRLRRWQKFLEKVGPDGLSREAQQGLYGELWFLRECLIPMQGHHPALLAWAGPTGAHHDFLLRSCAVEVKTTGTKEPQQMIIQSERQLDDAGLVALFLFHLAVYIRDGAGESLLAMIESLRQILQGTPEALDLYEDRLFEAGFVQAQAIHYGKTGYHVQQTHLFQVKDTFPRIIEADLKPGVGSVRYSISVAECRHFSATEAVLKSLLNRA